MKSDRSGVIKTHKSIIKLDNVVKGLRIVSGMRISVISALLVEWHVCLSDEEEKCLFSRHLLIDSAKLSSMTHQLSLQLFMLTSGNNCNSPIGGLYTH